MLSEYSVTSGEDQRLFTLYLATGLTDEGWLKIYLYWNKHSPVKFEYPVSSKLAFIFMSSNCSSVRKQYSCPCLSPSRGGLVVQGTEFVHRLFRTSIWRRCPALPGGNPSTRYFLRSKNMPTTSEISATSNVIGHPSLEASGIKF